MVEYTLETLSALTAERRRAMGKLAALPDGRIDTSDIAELSEAQWADAVRGRFYRPVRR